MHADASAQQSGLVVGVPHLPALPHNSALPHNDICGNKSFVHSHAH